MNLLKSIISFIYGNLLSFRHLLYERKFLKQYHPPIKTICVGNLEFGGTGKTPHAEYLLNFLISRGEKPAFLSRGYGRKTTGFRWVKIEDTWKSTGDEPLQVKNNFPEIPVAVCESRKTGIVEILAKKPDTTVVILDDAFQHLGVKPGFSILLTSADRPFTQNKLFPAGSLRDIKDAAKNADVIIFAKANRGLEVAQYLDKPTFNSYLNYGKPISVGSDFQPNIETCYVLFCGIAKPDSFIFQVKSMVSNDSNVRIKAFSDHHEFSIKDIEFLKNIFSNIAASNKTFITTQKDWMRIKNTNLENQFFNLPFLYLPLEINFGDKEYDFLSEVDKYLKLDSKI